MKMVGRGWWLLLWTLCAAWMVCVVCRESYCRKGQEFYNSRKGRCMPCTRCHSPQVVVVPCYVFRDAVCAPAAHFLPTWSHILTQPQPPITLSTPTTSTQAASREDGNGSQTSDPSKESHEQSKNKNGYGHHHNFSGRKTDSSSIKIDKNDSVLHSQNGSEKRKNRHHRHRHNREHADNNHGQDQSLSVDRQNTLVNGGNFSQKCGANESVSERSGNSSSNSSGSNSSRNDKCLSVDGSDGANSDKERNSDPHQSQTYDWEATFFLTAIIVISIFVIMLTLVILSHIRNVFIQQKLKHRGVFGPTSMPNTNMYIEAWQQQDTQPGLQHLMSSRPLLVGLQIPLQETVSTIPNPVPFRTYRLPTVSGPAEEPLRGVAPTRGSARGVCISTT